MQLVLPLNTDLPILDGLPPWLTAFIRQAVDEHRTPAANGAHHAVSARVARLTSLLDAATRYLDTEIGIDEAAAATGRHPETIRRAVRMSRRPAAGTTKARCSLHQHSDEETVRQVVLHPTQRLVAR